MPTRRRLQQPRGVGASVKTCQVLARYLTPSLRIGVYPKASLRDITIVVEALPELTPEFPTPETMAATGTDSGSAPKALDRAQGTGPGGYCRLLADMTT
jgi:hypothetical protein